jgi:hypothetical protein
MRLRTRRVRTALSRANYVSECYEVSGRSRHSSIPSFKCSRIQSPPQAALQANPMTWREGARLFLKLCEL